MGDQSPHRRKRRSVHVGERSVYGTEDSTQSLIGTPSEYRLGGLAASQDGQECSNQLPHTEEWSGDTLVSSQAQDFIEHDSSSDNKRWDNALLVSRKRASPGKRFRGPLSVAQIFDKEVEWDIANNGTHSFSAPLGTNNDTVEQRQDSAPSDHSTIFSNETVLLTGSKHDTVEAAFPQDSTWKTTESETKATRVEHHQSTPQVLTSDCSPKKLRSTKRIMTKNQWRSPCQEDFSPKASPRKRMKRSADASSPGSRSACTGVSSFKVRGGIGRQETRIRCRSLSRLADDRGQESGIQSPDRSCGTKRTAFIVGRADGQKVKQTLRETTVSPRFRKRSGQSTSSWVSFSSMSSEDSAQVKCSSPSKLVLPPRSPYGKPYSTVAEIQDLPSNGIEDCDGQSTSAIGDDDPGYAPSPDSDHDGTPGQIFPRKNRVPTSPDISDRPWLRRKIPSARYFPEETGSPTKAGPMRKPFWIHFEGELVVCFPTNCDPGSYEVVVLAKIHLTEQVDHGWRSFRIPSLPRLEIDRAPGQISFSISGVPQYEIDRIFLESSYACGPNLAIGSSRFGSSPLLRLRTEPQKGERHGSWEQYKVLAALGSLDGGPDNDMFLWLFAEMGKAMSGSPSKVPNFSTWFAQLDFDRLRSAMAAILRRPNAKPKIAHQTAEWTNSSNKADHTSMNERGDLSSRANDKKKTSLAPAYFAGLFTEDDPFLYEEPSKLAWNFGLAVDRSINGKLRCCLSVYFLCGSPPQLTIDARDWRPIFGFVNGKIATQMEWQQTEDGDLALHHVKGLDGGKAVKVDLQFQELTVGDAFTTSEAGKSRSEIGLPNIVDKVILGGSVNCNLDNATITLTQAKSEDVLWRTDPLSGRNQVALPKLSQGYRMYLALYEQEADELETLPDMETVLDLAATSTPDPRHPSALDTASPSMRHTSAHDERSSGPKEGILPYESIPAESTKPSAQNNRSSYSREHNSRHKLIPSSAAPAAAPSPSLAAGEHRPASDDADSVRPSARRRMAFGPLIRYLVLALVLLVWVRFRDGGAVICRDDETQIGVEERAEGRLEMGWDVDGDVSAVERISEEGGGKRNWRDSIDYALGWRELEG